MITELENYARDIRVISREDVVSRIPNEVENRGLKNVEIARGLRGSTDPVAGRTVVTLVSLIMQTLFRALCATIFKNIKGLCCSIRVTPRNVDLGLLRSIP